MNQAHPQLPLPAPDAKPAEWLASRLSNVGTNWVTATVGAGWPAYARIFHPLDDTVDALRWSSVAAANGRTMYPAAQWEVISSNRSVPGGPRGRGFPGAPELGHLNQRSLSAVCQLLAPHTTTAEQCWFALWDGRAWMHAAGASMMPKPSRDSTAVTLAPRQLDLSAPRFALPYRSYYLFGGALQDAVRLGYWVTADSFRPQSPNLMWPNDHAWCLASEIDFDTTLVGGSRQLISDLTASPRLEVLAISPTHALEVAE